MSIGLTEQTPLMMSATHSPVIADSGTSLINISSAAAEGSDKEKWEFVIVYPAQTSEGKNRALDDARNRLVEKLQMAGLTVERRESREGTEIYLLIKATELRLEEQAELLGMGLQLKADLSGGACKYTIAKRELFKRNDAGELFSKTQKQYLIENIITSDDDDGGAEVDLDRLQYDDIITKAYPLHEDRAKETIIDEWVKQTTYKSFRYLPLDTLRNYFGEEIAFYYGWLYFYTKWLWIASIVGLICFILGYSDIKNENKWTNSIYSLFMAIWVTLFLEFWKRERNVLAYKWHMLDYEEAEGVRPGFIGEERIGTYSRGEFVELKPTEIYGLSAPKMTRFFPKEKVRIKMLAGLGIIFMLCCVVAISSISVLTFRLFMQNTTPNPAPSVVGGILNAVAIMVLNKVYRTIATKMNEWENHRTVSEFYDNLLFKIFLFQFVNSYTSLYYIAFFKKHTFMWGEIRLKDSCGDYEDDYGNNAFGWGCPNQLEIQLLTILLTNIVVGQAQEVLIPWALAKFKAYYYQYRTNYNEKDLPKYERENLLSQHEGTFDEYSEMVIQYGYLVLFAAAFPLAPLLAVLNNMVEMRTDTFKWLTSYNKPVPRGACDIGGWYTILEIIGVVGVITNSLLIAFSFPTVYQIFKNPYQTFVAVVIIEHAILVAKYIIALIIPDMPSKVRIVLAKQHYVQQQILKKYERRSNRRGRGATGRGTQSESVVSPAQSHHSGEDE